jgi:hypothetical protein
MATEVKEELVLIAERHPPGDQWVLLVDPNHVYKSLTEVLEGYFEEVGGLTCDFRLSPMKGKLYAIDSVVVEKAPPPPPLPPKKFNMYGDY